MIRVFHPALASRVGRPRPLLIALMLCFCMLQAGENQEGSTQTAGVLTSSDGAYHLRYQITPIPLKLQQTFAIKVAVFTDAAMTQAAEDITLTVDGRMPQHRHGMNTEPVVRPMTVGVFEVEGMLFHMAGRWQLIFDITRNGETVRAQTALEL